MGTATEQRVPPAPPLPVPRLDALTGLRALAAGLVFFHHTFSPSIVPGSLVRLPGTGWLRSLADTGVTGVTFFFVLSGFVLAWSWDDTRTTAGFYARRFARVWPLHAVVLVLATVAVLPLLGRPGAPVAGTLAALALVQSWVPDPHVYFAGNGPSWSLSCEAAFYLLLPLLVPRLRRHAGPRAGWLAAGACVAFLAAAPVLVHAATTGRFALLSLWVFPGYRVGEFVLGVVVGWAFRCGWRPRWSVLQATAALAVAYPLAAWVLGPVFHDAVPGRRPLGNLGADLLVLLPVAALVAAVADRDLRGVRSRLGSPLAVRLGAASFAFYLTHSSLVLAAGRLDGGWRAGHGLPLVAATLLVCLAVAELLHRGVERPAEAALRRRIEAREAAR